MDPMGDFAPENRKPPVILKIVPELEAGLDMLMDKSTNNREAKTEIHSRQRMLGRNSKPVSGTILF